MATQPKQLFTFEEYLAQERRADYKSEFHDGDIYAMSGGTEPHSRLALRMGVLLDRYLGPCRVYDSNLKVYIEEFNKGVYPDCMAVCGEPHFWRSQKDVITNPTVVVEVLSPSTEEYDKKDKSSYYRSIPSLRHCLVIAQQRVFVEHSARQDEKSWNVTQFRDRTGTIKLAGMGSGVEILVDDIYRSML